MRAQLMTALLFLAIPWHGAVANPALSAFTHDLQRKGVAIPGIAPSATPLPPPCPQGFTRSGHGPTWLTCSASVPEEAYAQTDAIAEATYCGSWTGPAIEATYSGSYYVINWYCIFEN